MNQVIIDAITEQRLLSLWWQGGTRTVQPHAYGLNTKGNDMMRSWQVSGFSRSHKIPAWKPILVNDARSFVMLDDHFDPHDQYQPNDKHLTHIYAQI